MIPAPVDTCPAQEVRKTGMRGDRASILLQSAIIVRIAESVTTFL